MILFYERAINKEEEFRSKHVIEESSSYLFHHFVSICSPIGFQYLVQVSLQIYPTNYFLLDSGDTT